MSSTIDPEIARSLQTSINHTNISAATDHPIFCTAWLRGSSSHQAPINCIPEITILATAIMNIATCKKLIIAERVFQNAIVLKMIFHSKLESAHIHESHPISWELEL